jgi:polyhydroxyalkanoate synthesis repressor PhaR
VRKLVTEGVSFQVVDVRSKEDITRSILLQIITEQEESGEPIFTSDALTKIIRAYGKNIENVMGDFLERSLEAFTEQQQAMTKQMQSLIGGDPVSMMTDITKRNFEMWSNMQQELLSSCAIALTIHLPKLWLHAGMLHRSNRARTSRDP